MKNVTKEKILSLRKQYIKGTRVRLLKMDDEQAPPIGTLGEVIFVDDMATIHVKWDNGCGLGVVFGEDLCEIVNPESVQTICYDKVKTWESREKALEYFRVAMAYTEGSEHQRYCNIYMQLQLGESVCRDI